MQSARAEGGSNHGSYMPLFACLPGSKPKGARGPKGVIRRKPVLRARIAEISSLQIGTYLHPWTTHWTHGAWGY
jgi:hypothetical protein